MIVKMIQSHGNRTEKIQEMFNKDLEELKSKQTRMKNTINEIKNSLEGNHQKPVNDSSMNLVKSQDMKLKIGRAHV